MVVIAPWGFKRTSASIIFGTFNNVRFTLLTQPLLLIPCNSYPFSIDQISSDIYDYDLWCNF